MSISSNVRTSMENQSWVRRMFELGLEMKKLHGENNVFDLSLGNPILEPPETFVLALQRLAADPTKGMHRYMPNAGYPETRGQVAQYLSQETGADFSGLDIVMTCGAGGALNVVFKSILEPGDEVIVLSPFFPEYEFYVNNHNGHIRPTPTDSTFQPDIKSIDQSMNKQTKAVLLNSPNNPTGAVYTSEILAELGALLQHYERKFNHQIYLISDEPYKQLIYDGTKFPIIYEFHESTIVATSFSKDLSLAGERIGYIAVNPELSTKSELLDAFVFCNRVLGFVNAPAIMQRAIGGILGASVDLQWYKTQRDFLFDNLSEMGYEIVKPQGAFFAFPKSPIPNDVDFVQELLAEHILVTPGTGFGTPGYFRVSYSVNEKVLTGAMDGFSRIARKYGLKK